MLPALLIFAEVANKQSFTRAAKQFGMSKSAVSQQIKRLEQDIGQQLLSRHTRGMSLTASGERLLRRCELLRDQVDLALAELDNNKDMPVGTFALTIPYSVEKDIVIPALCQLCREFPKIEPDILVTDSPKDLIRDNLDVAIFAGDLKDSNYRAQPIGRASEIFCATPAYVLKHGELNQKSDLSQHRIIATSWQTNKLTIYKNNDFAEKHIVTPNYIAKSNTLPSVVDMVLHEMGVALLPHFVIQSEFATGRLVRVLSDYQGWQWPFYMVHRFHREKPMHITRFYQLTKHFFLKSNPSL